jgi:hypothetical protein
VVGVDRGGERGGDRGPVEQAGVHAEGGQGAGGVRATAAGRHLAGGADGDQHLPAQRVPGRGQLVEELGVAGGGLPERGVGQQWRGLAHRLDVRAQVHACGGDGDLGGGGEAVQPAGEPAQQGGLLGGGAQPEVDRARGDHRGGAGPGRAGAGQAQQPGGADRVGGQPQRRRHRGWGGGAGKARGGGIRRSAGCLGAGRPAHGHRGEQPGVQRAPVAAAERDRGRGRQHRPAGGQRHRRRQAGQGRGGQAPQPVHDRGGGGEDGQLPERQPPHDPVRGVDVGGDGRPRRSVHARIRAR